MKPRTIRKKPFKHEDYPRSIWPEEWKKEEEEQNKKDNELQNM